MFTVILYSAMLVFSSTTVGSIKIESIAVSEKIRIINFYGALAKNDITYQFEYALY